MDNQPMAPRERFLACAAYEPVDHIPLWEWGPWPSTLRRWQREGLGEGNHPPQYAECDRKVRPTVDLWMLPRFEERIICEDDISVTGVSDRGVVMRTFKDPDMTSMPEHLEYPVKTWAGWEDIKRRYDPESPDRFPADWKERCAEWKRDGTIVELAGSRSPSLFGFVREMLGPERALTVFAEDPDLIHDMMEFNTEFLLAFMPKVFETVEVTTIMFWEDMCYRNGPLISPRMFKTFMVPRYKRLTELAARYGVDQIYVDCDGNIEQLIPHWLESGIRGMFPMEVAAGMDVGKTRREYGRDCFMIGGIDKRVLARDRNAIDAELDRVMPVAEEGGYIPHLDHAVPHDVPYDNFCYYWERKKSRIGVL